MLTLRRQAAELPFVVEGRACGGTTISADTLSAEYEVIYYVLTDKWYIQPFVNDFRHPISSLGLFSGEAHSGTYVHAFLARKGLTVWPANTQDLPEVDGVDVIAEAEVDANGKPSTRALTVEVTGKGQVTCDPDIVPYLLGQVVELAASPSAGWRFVGWQGDCNGPDPNACLRMGDDKTVTAVFDVEPIPWEPLVDAAPGFPNYPCQHQLVQDCEADPNTCGTWADIGATVALGCCEGIHGQALEITYDLATPNSAVVAWYELALPLDLSDAQFVRFSYRGVESTAPHHVDIKFKDGDGDEFNARLAHVAHVPAWVTQYVPRGAFQDQNEEVGNGLLDWSGVTTVLIGVARAATDAYKPGATFSGVLCVDEITAADCTCRITPDGFETSTGDLNVAAAAADWIGSQQNAVTHFVKSWQDDPNALGHIYDQALALLVLMRTHPDAAHRLADALASVQQADGSWQRVISTIDGTPSGDKWLGDIAWAVYALARYAAQFSDAAEARDAALRGASYLHEQLTADADAGWYVSDATEGNIDAWWAFQAVGRTSDADAVKAYLLGKVWDPAEGRWWRGRVDPGIALDSQTWAAPFAVAAGQPQHALRALAFAAETLRTTDFSDDTVGLDGQGPFSVWYEGIAEYVCARGSGAQWLLDHVLNPAQNANGSMPGSTDDWTGDGVWLTESPGIAPTAWLYFANTSSPLQVGPFVTP